jgi:hypothetical protein
VGSLTREVFDRLVAPGPRLPWLREWLLGEVWTPKRYDTLGPIAYLERGEQEVNELEDVLATGAARVYDELTADPPPARDLRAFLDRERPSAAVIFDGLSLREVPVVLRLADESGLRVTESDVSVAAVPSDTVDFVEQRLRAGRISPSALPGRRELRDAGIEAFYYDHEGRRHQLRADCPVLCLWSAFPDQTYQDSGARFANHFAELQRRLEAVWRNTVQAIPPGRRIVVTSDHGYIFFGHGCSAPRTNPALRPLTEWLGGERSRLLGPGEAPPPHPDLAVFPHRRVAMVRGRVQTHPPGPAAARLYKHGGLSLMEMLTPWLILDSAAS